MKAGPVDRPLPGMTQTYRGRVSTGGTLVIGPFHVFVGGRHKGLATTTIGDGDRITVFTGNNLIRVLDADPASRYQPLGAAADRPRWAKP